MSAPLSFPKEYKQGHNEDAVLPAVRVGDCFWAAVADGMGGHVGGDIASRTVIDEMRSQITSDPQIAIRDLFALAQKRLKAIGDKNPDLTKMGTTLSLLRICGNVGEVGHVGDSRIYHLRSDGIVDRTVDQTEVQELVERGVLRKGDAKRYPRRNVLLSVLSPERPYDLYQDKFEIRPGDRILLLTDGVLTSVLRREIRDISLANRNPTSFCNELMRVIKSRTPTDDHSVVCLDLAADATTKKFI
jgi:PPM family protein phosphatase